MTDEMINALNAIDGYAIELKLTLQKTVLEFETKNPGYKFEKLDCKVDEYGTYHFTPKYKKLKQ